jgi:hypothetical protein
MDASGRHSYPTESSAGVEKLTVAGPVSLDGSRLPESVPRPAYEQADSATPDFQLAYGPAIKGDESHTRGFACSDAVRCSVDQGIEREGAGPGRPLSTEEDFRHVLRQIGPQCGRWPSGWPAAAWLLIRRILQDESPRIARRMRSTHPVADAMVVVAIPVAHLVLVSLRKRDESRQGNGGQQGRDQCVLHGGYFCGQSGKIRLGMGTTVDRAFYCQFW